MAGVAVSIELNGIEKVQAVLAKLEAAGKNMTPLMDEIGAYLDSETALRFKDSVDPDRNLWKQSNRARDEIGKTLVDHGHLRDSFTHIASKSSVTHGSNIPYAAIHQFGGKTGRGHKSLLPQRKILGLNATDKTEILAMAKSFFKEQGLGK